MNGKDNPTFTADEFIANSLESNKVNGTSSNDEKQSSENVEEALNDRENWGKGIEFLFSCIALSVGLGNIWRFPYVALANGGGAFVIPYIIVLVLIGKPVYFLEMAMGQFSSGNSVKVFNCVPALRGVGLGQAMATVYTATFYSSIMATTLRYLFDSFRTTLPWSYCRPEWGPCIPSAGGQAENQTWTSESRSSAELYFTKEVIRAQENILDGIGWPIWNLVGFLVLSWAIVSLILWRGVKSIGKASYVLAISPYVVLIALLVRALTLPGAWNGIQYFFAPQWDKILEPSVWYAAVTQVFFSLNIFFGSIVMYSSYNKFDHNVYRDANIVTTLDTFTSLLAGSTIFGIIGHLAHEVGVEDISLVVKNGPGLAFISYPDAISKFKTFPQIYAVLFFLMLFVLGIGSNVAMASCATTLIKDRFKQVKNWQATLGFATFGVLIGSLYLTPGGQSVLQLVDFYGATFVVFILAIFELYAFCYIYGTNRICKDIHFMLGFIPNIFWKACWWVLTPGLMTIIAIYILWNFELTKDGDYEFPVIAHVIGWFLTATCLVPVLVFAVHRIVARKGNNFWEKFKEAFRPTSMWGPKDFKIFQEYKQTLRRSE